MQDFVFYLANNHALLLCFFSHPRHPFSRTRALLVLLNSLTFGFFVSAVLALVPFAPLQSVLAFTVGTLAQIAWDVPAAMLGRCACAHVGPRLTRRCCGALAFALLALHTCIGVVWALLGLALVGWLPSFPRHAVGRSGVGAVLDHFVSTKLAAWAWAVPAMAAVFALVRSWEQRETRHVQAAHLSREGVGRARGMV